MRAVVPPEKAERRTASFKLRERRAEFVAAPLEVEIDKEPILSVARSVRPRKYARHVDIAVVKRFERRYQRARLVEKVERDRYSRAAIAHYGRQKSEARSVERAVLYARSERDLSVARSECDRRGLAVHEFERRRSRRRRHDGHAQLAEKPAALRYRLRMRNNAADIAYLNAVRRYKAVLYGQNELAVDVELAVEQRVVHLVDRALDVVLDGQDSRAALRADRRQNSLQRAVTLERTAREPYRRRMTV